MLILLGWMAVGALAGPKTPNIEKPMAKLEKIADKIEDPKIKKVVVAATKDAEDKVKAVEKAKKEVENAKTVTEKKKALEKVADKSEEAKKAAEKVVEIAEKEKSDSSLKTSELKTRKLESGGLKTRELQSMTLKGAPAIVDAVKKAIVEKVADIKEVVAEVHEKAELKAVEKTAEKLEAAAEKTTEIAVKQVEVNDILKSAFKGMNNQMGRFLNKVGKPLVHYRPEEWTGDRAKTNNALKCIFDMAGDMVYDASGYCKIILDKGKGLGIDGKPYMESDDYNKILELSKFFKEISQAIIRIISFTDEAGSFGEIAIVWQRLDERSQKSLLNGELIAVTEKWSK